jgi:hypothetical protein
MGLFGSVASALALDGIKCEIISLFKNFESP